MILLIRKSIIAAVFLLGAIYGFCQPIALDRTFQSLQLDTHVLVWQDVSKGITIDQILSGPSHFVKNQRPTLNFSFTNSYIWIQVDLINVDSVTLGFILEIENPHLNKLQLFSVFEGKTEASLLTGDNLPYHQRLIKHPHFLFPISLDPGQSKRYYLWVDKHGEQVIAPMRLWSIHKFEEHNTRMSVFWGFVLGTSTLFCLLSFIIFLFNTEYLSFYYWGYTCSVLIYVIGHTGLGFQHLWGDWTWWQSAARPTAALLCYVFYLLFARAFFDIPGKSKFLNYYTYGLLGMVLLMISILWSQNPVLGLFENYWYSPDYYSGENLMIFSKVLSYLVATLTLLSILAISLYFYFKERKKESLWFAFSFAMLFAGGISIVLLFSGVIPGNIFTKNIVLITNTLETIILALLVANRFNSVRIENTRMTMEIADQKQKNATRLMEGQLMERNRLSQHLHDGVSLSLANIRLRLSMLAQSSPGQKAEIEGLVDDLGATGQDIRQISHALSPVLLEKYGLKDSVEELIDQTTQAQPNLKIDYEHSGKTYDDIPEVIAQTIYFTIQELLSNITKHADATHASVKMDRDFKRIIIQVNDNGDGYNPDEATEGIGLRNIYSRVQLLNGIVKVKKEKKGMSHIFEIPF